jgi:cellulose synthase/poly-beta-1,6-N-acetylglucosamine synthase-like glycosyltransferase
MLWPLVLFDFSRAFTKSIFSIIYEFTKRKEEVSNRNYNPFVSIIIPAHNEENNIVRTIESALETDYNNKEIIVIDDESKDTTYQLAYPYFKKGLIKLIRRIKSNGTKAGAVNHGLLFADGEVIIIIDADTLIGRESIRKMISPLQNKNHNSVAGNIRIFNEKNKRLNLLRQFQKYEYLISFELGRAFNSFFGNLLFVSGCFGAFKRKYFDSVGNYDIDTITEDLDLSIKIGKHEGKILFQRQALCYTVVPNTLSSWIKQRIRWSRGQIEAIWKHKNIFFGGNFPKKLILSFIDMIFMDVLLLYVRFVWLISLLFYHYNYLGYIFLLITIIYICIEYFVFISSIIITRRYEDLKLFFIVPFVVLIYRQLYSVIRLYGYFGWLRNKTISW